MAASLWLAGCRKEADDVRKWRGRPVPALALPGLDGGRLALGKGPALLNFWATWCSPCRAEMASLNRLYRELAGQGLVVVGICVDDDLNLVREYLRRQALDFPIVLDPAGKLAREAYAVPGFPTTWLVDRDGRCRDAWVGERDWDAPTSRAAVAGLLAG